MGKGRFKIPASEVERLLAGPKLAPLSQVYRPVPNRDDVVSHMPPRISLGVADSIDEPFDIFPWFFALTAMVTGVSLFIFSTSSEMMVIAGLSWLLWIQRVLFLISGIGCLWTLLLGNGNVKVRGMSYAMGAIASFVLLGVCILLNRPVGALLFGAFGVGIISSFFTRGIRAFAVHLLLILTGLCVLGGVFPANSGVEQLIPSGIAVAVPTIALIWLAASILSGVLYHIGKRQSKGAGIAGVGILFFLLSFIAVGLAQHFSWILSFFILSTAVTMVVAVVWDPETLARRSDKAVFTMTYLLIGSVFLVTIGVVHVISSSLLSTMADTLEDRVTYGKVVTVSAIDVAKGAIEGIAQNTAFGDAVGKKSEDILRAYSRGLLEGNRLIAEVHIIDTTGAILQSYPVEENPQEEITGVIELMNQALTAGKPLVRTYLYTERGKTNPFAWIAVPVYDGNRQMVGGIAASMNFGELSDSLQKIGRSERGEYLEIMDREGRMIVHPKYGDTGESGQHKHMTSLGGEGKKGLIKTIDERGEMVLQSYDSVGRMDWGISAMAPVYSSMELMPVAGLVVSLVVVSTILCIGMALMVRTVRRKVSIEAP